MQDGSYLLIPDESTWGMFIVDMSTRAYSGLCIGADTGASICAFMRGNSVILEFWGID